MIHHHLLQVALCEHVSHIVQGRFPYCQKRNHKTNKKLILKINENILLSIYKRKNSMKKYYINYIIISSMGMHACNTFK